MNNTDKIDKFCAVNDGMLNVLTSLGTDKARTPHSYIASEGFLNSDYLAGMYVSDGFVTRIIDLYAKTMVREWILVLNKYSDKINSYLDFLKAEKAYLTAMKWSRLYGGALIVMFVDDGLTLEQPLNLNALRKIHSLHVYDLTNITISTSDLYTDVTNLTTLGKVKYYTIMPTVEVAVSPFRVHESRVIRFEGLEVPNVFKSQLNGWGMSEIQAIYSQFINFTQSYAYSSEILHDFVLAVLSLNNMSEYVSIEGGDKLLKDRLEIIAKYRSVINMAVVGKDDTYTKQSSSIIGLPDLIDKFGEALSAVCGIPLSILMDKWDGGLGDTGNSQTRAWYDFILAEQKAVLKEPIQKLLNVIAAAQDSGIPEGEKIAFKFNPLWQRSMSDIVKDRNVQAETDQVYMDNNVVDSEEVRVSRFGADAYDIETKLDPKFNNSELNKLKDGDPDPNNEDDDDSTAAPA